MLSVFPKMIAYLPSVGISEHRTPRLRPNVAINVLCSISLYFVLLSLSARIVSLGKFQYGIWPEILINGTSSVAVIANGATNTEITNSFVMFIMNLLLFFCVIDCLLRIGDIVQLLSIHFCLEFH